jgi:hypothetical protein
MIRMFTKKFDAPDPVNQEDIGERTGKSDGGEQNRQAKLFDLAKAKRSQDLWQ